MPMWLAGPHAGDGSEIQQDGDQRDKEEKGQIKAGGGGAQGQEISKVS